jgi:hypothetical protein
MSHLEPTYLRYIYDGLIKGSIHPENAADLPDGLIGLYEEAFDERNSIVDRQKLLQHFTIWALLKKAVSASFVAEVLNETEESILNFIATYSAWFNSPESGKYQLYHERLKVYLLQKLSEGEIHELHENLITRLEQTIEEQQADEFEWYALEFLSEHLSSTTLAVDEKERLHSFANDEHIWKRQIQISEDLDWTHKSLNAAISKFVDLKNDLFIVESLVNQEKIGIWYRNNLINRIQLIEIGNIRKYIDYSKYWNGENRLIYLFSLLVGSLKRTNPIQREYIAETQKILEEIGLLQNDLGKSTWKNSIPMKFIIFCAVKLIKLEISPRIIWEGPLIAENISVYNQLPLEDLKLLLAFDSANKEKIIINYCWSNFNTKLVNQFFKKNEKKLVAFLIDNAFEVTDLLPICIDLFPKEFLREFLNRISNNFSFEITEIDVIQNVSHAFIKLGDIKKAKNLLLKTSQKLENLNFEYPGLALKYLNTQILLYKSGNQEEFERGIKFLQNDFFTTGNEHSKNNEYSLLLCFYLEQRWNDQVEKLYEEIRQCTVYFSQSDLDKISFLVAISMRNDGDIEKSLFYFEKISPNSFYSKVYELKFKTSFRKYFSLKNEIIDPGTKNSFCDSVDSIELGVNSDMILELLAFNLKESPKIIPYKYLPYENYIIARKKYKLNTNFDLELWLDKIDDFQLKTALLNETIEKLDFNTQKKYLKFTETWVEHFSSYWVNQLENDETIHDLILKRIKIGYYDNKFLFNKITDEEVKTNVIYVIVDYLFNESKLEKLKDAIPKDTDDFFIVEKLARLSIEKKEIKEAIFLIERLKSMIYDDLSNYAKCTRILDILDLYDILDQLDNASILVEHLNCLVENVEKDSWMNYNRSNIYSKTAYYHFRLGYDDTALNFTQKIDSFFSELKTDPYRRLALYYFGRDLNLFHQNFNQLDDDFSKELLFEECLIKNNDLNSIADYFGEELSINSQLLLINEFILIRDYEKALEKLINILSESAKNDEGKLFDLIIKMPFNYVLKIFERLNDEIFNVLIIKYIKYQFKENHDFEKDYYYILLKRFNSGAIRNELLSIFAKEEVFNVSKNNMIISKIGEVVELEQWNTD